MVTEQKLQYDEVDEEDGCKVQVTEYHILSANGQEELTKTCRRKFKIECNQSTRKTEIANGFVSYNLQQDKLIYSVNKQ